MTMKTNDDDDYDENEDDDDELLRYFDNFHLHVIIGVFPNIYLKTNRPVFISKSTVNRVHHFCNYKRITTSQFTLITHALKCNTISYSIRNHLINLF